MPIDAQLLADWFDAHAAAMVLYARQWVAVAAAEDLVQDVFLRAAALRQAPESPRAWLLTCTRHAAIDWHRRRRRETAGARNLAANRPLFAPSAGAGPDVREIQAVLAKLPPQAREIVTLRVWAQATFEEIAGILDLPISTVFYRYRGALSELRRFLEESCPKK